MEITSLNSHLTTFSFGTIYGFCQRFLFVKRSSPLGSDPEGVLGGVRKVGGLDTPPSLAHRSDSAKRLIPDPRPLTSYSMPYLSRACRGAIYCLLHFSMLHANCLQGDPIFSLAPFFVLCYPIHTFQFGSIYFNELASSARSVH